MKSSIDSNPKPVVSVVEWLLRNLILLLLNVVSVIWLSGFVVWAMRYALLPSDVFWRQPLNLHFQACENVGICSFPSTNVTISRDDGGQFFMRGIPDCVYANFGENFKNCEILARISKFAKISKIEFLREFQKLRIFTQIFISRSGKVTRALTKAQGEGGHKGARKKFAAAFAVKIRANTVCDSRSDGIAGNSDESRHRSCFDGFEIMQRTGFDFADDFADGVAAIQIVAPSHNFDHFLVPFDVDRIF